MGNACCGDERANAPEADQQSAIGTGKIRRGTGHHTYAIEVTVAQAQKLPGMDLTGSVDPYVELHVGSDMQKTQKIKNNKNPVWNQMFQFTFAKESQAQELKLRIMDWDRFTKNDLIAEATIPITGYNKKRQYEWVELKDAKGRDAGRLQLVIEGREFVQKTTDISWTHLLQLTAVEAKGLPNVDLTGTIDPYAQFYWGGFRFATQRHDHNANPQWNETCYIFINQDKEEDYQLVVNVADHDSATKDDVVGHLYMSGSELFNLNGRVTKRLTTKDIDQEQEIENKQNPEFARAESSVHGKSAGDITLDIQLIEREVVKRKFATDFLTQFDTNDDGMLSEDEIVHAFADLGILDGGTSEDEAQLWFRSHDKDGSGDLSFEEFAGILDKKEFQNAKFMPKIMNKYIGRKEKLMDSFVTAADVRFESQIVIRDRKSGMQVSENIPNKVRVGLSVLYSSKASKWFANSALWDKISIQASVNKGKKYNKPESVAEIPAFVETYAINMKECVIERPEDFGCFNDFFARAIKPECRPIAGRGDDTIIPSGADCRFMCFQDTLDSTKIWVKGESFSLNRVFTESATPNLADKMDGGPWCIFRLAPQDYHRWHYPVGGRITRITGVKGALFTVNPVAINSTIDVYGNNKRAIIEIENEALGTVVMVAVGAMMVGAYTLFASDGVEAKVGSIVRKGDVAGEWRFGGSTVLVFFERAAKVVWDSDLIKNSMEPIETRIYCGEKIATAGSGEVERGRAGTGTPQRTDIDS